MSRPLSPQAASPKATSRSCEQTGFTLIELMVAIAIVGILAGIAYPSYTTYITRSHRVDAKIALTSAVQNLERFYTERNTFTGASVGSNGIYPATSPNNYYTITLVVDPVRTAILPVGTTYLLTATPQGTQSSDSQCGTYTVDETGFKTAAGTSDSATLSRCW